MAVPQGVLFGMGNPLLDISGTVDEDFIKKYNLKKNDAILADPAVHADLYSDLVKSFKVDYIAGGATQNSIRVAQWILNVPHAASFVGCVGKDDYGKILRERAEGNSVKVAYLEDEKTPTGTCACLITGKERSLVANISAANNYKIAHLELPEVWGLVQSAKVMYISGFFLTVSPPSIMKVAQHAAEKNKLFCFNLAAPFISEFFKEPLMAVAPYWDFIFGNETEAAAFSKANGFGTEDLKEIAQKIADLPKVNTARPRTVVITHGSEATIVCHQGKVVEFPVEKLEPEKIVDTNGAGDAFVGGFLAQLTLGQDIEACIRCAHWAAKVVIQRSGATFPDKCEFQ
eukprot:m.42107 g.42107  ORF g.42107 m.42107 type:complete len:344 (+) comp14305_c1_seq2:876-1907(+)